MSPGRGVCVVGHSRTGTNMLAGVFAAHGFFFGDCRKPDDRNPKGFFENLKIYNGRRDVLEVLKEDGLPGRCDWGVKVGPGRYEAVKDCPFYLTLVTYRPKFEIKASRKKVKGFGTAPSNMNTKSITGPFMVINTSDLVSGDYTEVRKAFDLLERPFSEKLANDWIDPTIWNRGLET